jgi:hypothetical protein
MVPSVRGYQTISGDECIAELATGFESSWGVGPHGEYFERAIIAHGPSTIDSLLGFQHDAKPIR